MGKIAEVPYDQGVHIGSGAYGPVIAGICHRTQGHWIGDYHIGKFSSGPPDYSGFHWLIGEDFGEWCQFYDSDTKANHARGANEWAVGIEFSGNTGSPLNYWQLMSGSKIIRWVNATYHLPPTFYTGPRIGKARGWRGHVSVLGSDHTDTITKAEFDAMAGGTPAEVLKMGYGLVDATTVPEKQCVIGVDKLGNIYINAVNPNIYAGGYNDDKRGPAREDFVALAADANGYTIITDDLHSESFRWKA